MSYHSLFPLINFFNSIDLKVLDFDLVEAQGGSIRVYVGHKNQKTNYKKIQKQILLEKKIGLFKKNNYLKYYQRIQSQKKRIKKIIEIHILKNRPSTQMK